MKKKFFTLLGEERHLDWIEHEQVRQRYADWRVHAARVCASIGCPALRPEAYTSGRLDAQLDDGFSRFKADRTRNRFADEKLQVSSMFKWFKQDFEQNSVSHGGIKKLGDVFREIEMVFDKWHRVHRMHPGMNALELIESIYKTLPKMIRKKSVAALTNEQVIKTSPQHRTGQPFNACLWCF